MHQEFKMAYVLWGPDTYYLPLKLLPVRSVQSKFQLLEFRQVTEPIRTTHGKHLTIWKKCRRGGANLTHRSTKHTESAAACKVTWSPHSPLLFHPHCGKSKVNFYSKKMIMSIKTSKRDTWTSFPNSHHKPWEHIPHRSQDKIWADNSSQDNMSISTTSANSTEPRNWILSKKNG